MSSSPENEGRSSKSSVKSPCSPQAVGDAEADAEVLLDVTVVLSEEEVAVLVDDPLKEILENLPVTEEDPVDETI
jgi:hypothetical protein